MVSVEYKKEIAPIYEKMIEWVEIESFYFLNSRGLWNVREEKINKRTFIPWFTLLLFNFVWKSTILIASLVLIRSI